MDESIASSGARSETGTGDAAPATAPSPPNDAIESAARPAPPPLPHTSPRPSRAADGRARTLATLALLVGLGAAAAGGWNYLYPNVQPPDLSPVQSSLDTAGAALRDAQSSMNRLDTELAEMRTHVEELASSQESTARELNTLRDQTFETAESMQQLTLGDSAASGSWLRSEVEHLMQSANIALQLNHDPATALSALEAADDRLARLDDPALTPARAQLASEIAALRALPQPDLSGAALELGSLAARVEELPVAGTVPSPGTETAPATPQSAWRRALARVGAALKSMVTVQRTSGVEFTPLPEERYYLYRTLELELEAARLALLRGDSANYTQSVEAAERALQTRFDADDPGVRGALETLTRLQGIELVPEWPDISGSLAELRREPQ